MPQNATASQFLDHSHDMRCTYASVVNDRQLTSKYTVTVSPSLTCISVLTIAQRLGARVKTVKSESAGCCFCCSPC